MAYIPPHKWRVEDIAIAIVDEVSEGEVVTISVAVSGVTLFIMGEIVEDGERLVVRGAHVSSRDVNPNGVGAANLRRIARAVMEVGDYDEITVEGAPRTTGARPGHRPRPLRFARNPVAAADRGAGADERG